MLRQWIHFGISALVSVCIFLVGLALVRQFTAKAYEQGKQMGRDITTELPAASKEVTIVEGASVGDVAKTLQEDGIISSALFFQLENMLKGNSKPYPGGTYTLSTNMDVHDINQILYGNSNAVSDKTLTIPEGYTLQNIAERLESLELMPANDFAAACKDGFAGYQSKYSFLKDLPERQNPLEGYLFPNTYFVLQNPTPDQIITKMLDQFENIYTAEYKARADELSLTTDQVVTLASIVEKEFTNADERPKGARVLLNRLEADMCLEMPSTLRYVVQKQTLSASDYKTDSPYNTYVHKGLPAGPICNPSEDCIKAVLYAEEGDWLYAVLKDSETQTFVFTADKAEYKAAKETYKDVK